MKQHDRIKDYDNDLLMRFRLTTFTHTALINRGIRVLFAHGSGSTQTYSRRPEVLNDIAGISTYLFIFFFFFFFF